MRAAQERSSTDDKSQKQLNGELNEYKGPLTRSRARALELNPTVLTCLMLFSLILSTNAATPATACGEPKQGISVRFPLLRDCHVMERHQRSVWAKASIYTRKYVTTTAFSCTNHSRTICTNSFLHWTLKVTSDFVNVSGIAPELCSQLAETKEFDGRALIQRSKDRWETDFPESFSFGFLGTRCKTTSNYIIQFGSVAIYADDRLIKTNLNSSECKSANGVCITDHTLIWNATDIKSQCHYELIGTYDTYSTEHFVSVEELEASFRFRHYIRSIPECNLKRAYSMENDFLVVFQNRNIRGEFQKWIKANPIQVRRMNEEHDISVPQKLPQYVEDKLVKKEAHSVLGHFWEYPETLHDPVNAKLQYIYNILRNQINRKFPSMERSVCETNNAITLVARASPPTTAARILLQRIDVVAVKKSEDTLLVAVCHNLSATEQNATALSTIEPVIAEYTFKSSPLPALEKQRINMALSLLDSELERSQVTIGSGQSEQDTIDAIRDEGERLLWEAERQIGKASDEIQLILDGISRNAIVITASVITILCFIAGTIIYCRYKGRVNTNSDVHIQIQTNGDDARCDQPVLELKPMESQPQSSHRSIFSPPTPIGKSCS
ncbi:unnamed protein product [Anisakis simplex]|uniref:Glycoprotein n=1 Tax=Anisakis simplex TaxID=6269 RepID=A0A0M3K7Z9_ANISI|nr:unnamed protein product [Anisakis simplex]